MHRNGGFLVLLVGELGAHLFDQRAGRKEDRLLAPGEGDEARVNSASAFWAVLRGPEVL